MVTFNDIWQWNHCIFSFCSSSASILCPKLQSKDPKFLSQTFYFFPPQNSGTLLFLRFNGSWHPAHNTAAAFSVLSSSSHPFPFISSPSAFHQVLLHTSLSSASRLCPRPLFNSQNPLMVKILSRTPYTFFARGLSFFAKVSVAYLCLSGREFLKKGTCWPPPVFMILISFGEVALASIHTTHILYSAPGRLIWLWSHSNLQPTSGSYVAGQLITLYIYREAPDLMSVPCEEFLLFQDLSTTIS